MEKVLKKKNNTLDMTQGSLLKNLIIFAIPLALTGLLQRLFNTADIIVVGQFTDPSISSNAVAAIGATTPLIDLLLNLFLGLSVGATVLIARYFGAGMNKDLSETIHTAILISVISGVFLTVVGVVFARTFLIWMKTPDTVLDLATTYLQIYFAGTVITLLYNFGSAILRAVGDTKRPLIFLTVSGVANIGFNLFFVLLLHMDVEGVALGTLISQGISTILILICLFREKGALRFELKKLKIHADKLINILKIGVPAGIQSSLFSFSNIFLQSAINSFGDVTVAGNSAGGNIEGFVYVCMNSFHHAALSCVGQNLGAGNEKTIHKTLLYSLLCATVVGIVLCIVVILLGKPLLRLYLPSDENAVAEGMLRIKAIIPLYFLCGVMETISGVIRGAGFSMYPTIVNLIGVCGFRLLWIYTVFTLPAFHSISGLFLSYPISWTLVIVSLLVFYFVHARKIIHKQCTTTKSDDVEPSLAA